MGWLKVFWRRRMSRAGAGGRGVRRGTPALTGRKTERIQKRERHVGSGGKSLQIGKKGAASRPRVRKRHGPPKMLLPTSCLLLLLCSGIHPPPATPADTNTSIPAHSTPHQNHVFLII